jgi:MFS family permease
MRTLRWTAARNVKLLTWSMGLWGLGFGLYATLWPLYVEHLHGNAVSIGWLETGAAILTAVSAIPGGWWADRGDRRRILIWGSVVAVPAPLLFWWAPDWHWLFLGELLYFGSAFSVPAMQSYIQSIADRDLAYTYNLVTGAFAAGAVLGPAIGGWLASTRGFGPVFVLSAVCYTASTACLWPLTPDGPRAPNGSGRWPLVPRGRPRLYRWTGLAAALTFAGGLAGPYVVPYWRSTAHLSVETIGLFGSLGTLLTAVSGPLWGRVADRRGIPDTLALGLAISGGGLVGLWALPRLLPAQAVAAVLRGVGSAAMNLVGVAVGRVVPGVEAGAAYGMLNWVTQVAAALAPYPGSLLYQLDPAAPMVFTTALWFLTIVMILTRPAPPIKVGPGASP